MRFGARTRLLSPVGEWLSAWGGLGNLFSFGSDGNGRTGLNTNIGNTLVPTQVGTDTDWDSASAGSVHSLAVRDGRLFSFGSNANGRTGLNTTAGDTLVPTQVGTNTDWTSASAGSLHSLAIKTQKI